MLNAENRERQVIFCSSCVNVYIIILDDMMDVVHIDEKWFYLTEVKKN